MSKRLNFKEILEMNGGVFELKISFHKDYIQLHVWENEAGETISQMFDIDCNESFNTRHEGINWNICIPYENLILKGMDLTAEEKEDVQEFIDELLKKDKFFQELEERREKQREKREKEKLDKEKALEELAKLEWERRQREKKEEQERWIRR